MLKFAFLDYSLLTVVAFACVYFINTQPRLILTHYSGILLFVLKKQ